MARLHQVERLHCELEVRATGLLRKVGDLSTTFEHHNNNLPTGLRGADRLPRAALPRLGRAHSVADPDLDSFVACRWMDRRGMAGGEYGYGGHRPPGLVPGEPC